MTTTSKFHLSLAVKDLDASVRFYSVLFGAAPTKLKPGYAKFDLAEPALNLTMQPGDPCCITGLSHMGVRVESLAQVLAAKQRLQAAGLTTFDAMNTTCCHAVQDKIWITDPTGYRWEVYVFQGDAEAFSDAAHAEAVAAGSPCSSSACVPAGAGVAQPDAARPAAPDAACCAPACCR